ncbi:30S ribosomal protein S2 [Candidatus Legionella polyplacis]|uniref:Small ribosomal subunit protein uS2 n=1 Tax=Candidatus Legionella polyplacis TaxID=2005262 RepID=A0ABZ2GVI8_9GAMM
MNLGIRELLEAGVHFGHRTRFWNPKMSPYIFGSKDKIHIINLEKTLIKLKEAANYVSTLVMHKAKILYVGTKRAAQKSIFENANRCKMPYVNHRWLGGMLTNWKTVRQSIFRLKELREMRSKGILDTMIKKEALILLREFNKLDRSLGGIENMESLPDAIFIIDIGFEHIAVKEACRLKIPIIGVVDTNNNPDYVNYIIPGNDDSMKAIDIYVSFITNAIVSEQKKNFVEKDKSNSSLLLSNSGK